MGGGLDCDLPKQEGMEGAPKGLDEQIAECSNACPRGMQSAGGAGRSHLPCSSLPYWIPIW